MLFGAALSEAGKGVVAIVVACVVWGLSPLYYRALDHVPAAEVISHRILWAFVIFFGVILIRGRLGAFIGIFVPGRTLYLTAVASLLIAVNWGLFVWAVHAERAMESSLGYFIQPLVAVVIGVAIFAERPARVQWIAVALAFVAVVILAARGPTLPWLSVTLGLTFAIYGALKKSMQIGPTVSVTAEVLMVLPLALIWLWGAHTLGWGAEETRPAGAFGASVGESLLLMVSGLVTAGPLILMSYAARRIRMATVGVLQYVNPSLQFLCAVVIFAEPLTPVHMVAFPMIWLALILYSSVAFRKKVPGA